MFPIWIYLYLSQKAIKGNEWVPFPVYKQILIWTKKDFEEKPEQNEKLKKAAATNEMTNGNTHARQKLAQWKGSNSKQSTRWQHVSPLKVSAFCIW